MNHKRTKKKSELQMGFEPSVFYVFVGSNPIWSSDFFLCPFMVDSSHLPLFSFIMTPIKVIKLR